MKRINRIVKRVTIIFSILIAGFLYISFSWLILVMLWYFPGRQLWWALFGGEWYGGEENEDYWWNLLGAPANFVSELVDKL